MMSKATVLLSGGADSTICAAIAKQTHSEVHAITIGYGQRHAIELKSAKTVAQALNLDLHEIIDLGPVFRGASPLVSSNEVEQYNNADELPGGIASTFVHNRNMVFLSIAASRALALDCNILYTGLCQQDFSGYPDCRRVFVDSVADCVSLGNFGEEDKFTIVTPLMHLTKAQSVVFAQEVMGDRFDEIMRLTTTCYNGVKGGCGKCAACLLRDRGFNEAGIADPIWKFREVAANV